MPYYKRILLVDDDEDDQMLFSGALKDMDAGVDCMLASNGKQAFKLMESWRPDLIFLDLNMPVMNGLEFLTVLRKKRPAENTPVVIFTTSNSEIHIQKARQLGATAFLTKPADYDILCKKIQHILLSEPDITKDVAQDFLL